MVATRTHTDIATPLGDLTAVAEDGALVGLYFAGGRHRPAADTFGERADEGFDQLRTQLDEYFDGRRERFSLRTAARGEEFQHRVWRLLEEIPYGRTRTYGELARDLGDRSLAQAVGAACGRNPLCVVVPCHRVVGAGGSLTGYAGGLERKRYLLDLEEPAEVAASRLF